MTFASRIRVPSKSGPHSPILFTSSYSQANMAAWLLHVWKLRNLNGFHPFLCKNELHSTPWSSVTPSNFHTSWILPFGRWQKHCCGLNVSAHPLPKFICGNSNSEILMVSGGGAFGSCLGHEGGALMNGISVLIKETPPVYKRAPSPLPPWEDTASRWLWTRKKAFIMLAPWSQTSGLQDCEK